MSDSFFHLSVAWSRNRKLHELVEGVPVLLARNGKVFDAVLKRENISART